MLDGAAAAVGTATAANPVTCFGQVATIVGTSGDDFLTGTAGADVIVGLGGFDSIDGLAGPDRICGGSDVDSMLGGLGRDRIHGGVGNDLFDGGPGEDLLIGGAPGTEGSNPENSVLYTQATVGVTIDVAAGLWPDGDRVREMQVIYTGEQDDSVLVDDRIREVNLAGGDDFARVTAGRALLSGGNDDDRLVAGPDGNALGGGDGLDELIGGVGSDVLLGTHGSLFRSGAGDDQLTIDPGDHNPGSVTPVRAGAGDDLIYNSLLDDNIDAGEGVDVVHHLSFITAVGVRVDLAQGTASGWGSDTLVGVENIIGTSNADVIEGSSVPNELLGGAGADTVAGRGGPDRIFGELGDDDLSGGAGNDRVDGGPDNDTATTCETLVSIP
jgi:Ca2+-binding RTX toxin-like protein